jgi:hypothetical protein
MAGLVLDVVSALVDKSLVTKEDVAGVACYRLHETMREYASLKLRDAGESDLLEKSYVEYYRTRCLEAEDDARHQTAGVAPMGRAGDRQHSIGAADVPRGCRLGDADWSSPPDRLLLGYPGHHREHALV